MHIGVNKNKLLFILNSSKMHDQGSKPQLVKIMQKGKSRAQKFKNKRSQLQDFDPFELIDQFLHIRPPARNHQEQFFMFADNSPVKPEHMRNVLKIALKQLNLNSDLYCVHAMRVGRASDLLDCGVSVETIKQLGRWKSNAVFTYLHT